MSTHKTRFHSYLRSLFPISEEEFDRAFVYFKEQRLKKGEYFIEHGKVCKHVAYVDSGLLKSFYTDTKGQSTPTCFCSAGSFTSSYRSFILEKESDISIEALEDSVLLVITKEDLTRLYETGATWLNISRLSTEKELLQTEQYVASLNNDTAKEKYLRLVQQQPEVLQKASVSDIASYLGVTRRTLTRIRKELLQ